MVLLLQCAVLAGCTNSSQLFKGPPPAGIKNARRAPALAPLPTLPEQLPDLPASDQTLAGPQRGPTELERLEILPPADGEGPADGLLPPPWITDPSIDETAVHTAAPLELADVLVSVERSFPLLLSAEQERAAASGRRIAAEGAFDLNLRSRGLHQDGSFPSNRFDLLAEQASPWNGSTFFGGYRFGYGDYPVYYGDRLTADGGEFRAGVAVPLLRDAPIDARRAKLRQTQLGEPLAEADIQRLRLNFLRAAAHRYWGWVAAGEHYFINDELLQIARRRQAGLEEMFQRGQIAEFVVIDNRRLIAEREVFLVAAERRLQQSALELSLYYRNNVGNPVVPPSGRLPRALVYRHPAPVDVERLHDDVELALSRRPEMQRFRLLRQQMAVELQLAENQFLPALNATVAANQDTGYSKKSDLDRTVAEAGLMMEVPLQRRGARGRILQTNAAMTQLMAESQFARDQIVFEVQDAVSNLDRAHSRLERSREEQRIAQRVAELEIDRFNKGQGTLLEVNLRELAAAGAQSKVVDAFADFYRALADYRAAIGATEAFAQQP